jgi:hypothetical protein
MSFDHLVGAGSAEPGGMERSSAGVAADGGKMHFGHPGPKPVHLYWVQSW